MSSETPGPAPAPPPPPSDGHASDHDSSGDENERFGSFSAVQVVKVAAAPSTTASSAEHSSAVSDAATSGHASGQVEPVKSPQDELKFKIACMPILRLKMLKTKSSRADFFRKDQKRVLILNGFVLCYYEPIKHTDYPDKIAKGYLPLWMLSKLEADVSLAVPQCSLHYGNDVFTFKARKRFPDPARVFVTELLRRSDIAQKSGIMTKCPSEPKWHAQDKHATVLNHFYMTCREDKHLLAE